MSEQCGERLEVVQETGVRRGIQQAPHTCPAVAAAQEEQFVAG
ncbi:hypothetical protein ABQE57_20895 [Mycolicibacterium elephantis]